MHFKYYEHISATVDSRDLERKVLESLDPGCLAAIAAEARPAVPRCIVNPREDALSAFVRGVTPNLRWYF